MQQQFQKSFLREHKFCFGGALRTILAFLISNRQLSFERTCRLLCCPIELHVSQYNLSR